MSRFLSTYSFRFKRILIHNKVIRAIEFKDLYEHLKISKLVPNLD